MFEILNGTAAFHHQYRWFYYEESQRKMHSLSSLPKKIFFFEVGFILRAEKKVWVFV